MELAAMPQARRAERKFPALDKRLLPGNRPEDVRFSDVVVIEPVFCVRFVVIGVKNPAVKGNRDADLVFDIALAVQRSEGEILAGSHLEQLAGGC
jgi:hypothetical protein